MNKLEDGDALALDFGKIAKAAACCNSLMPVTLQNADTGEVILLAYTNEMAFKESVRHRRAILWSTSRNELWEKGAKSGNTFDLLEVFVNCEQNSLLYKVRPKAGGICHTNNKAGKPRNCFYRRINLQTMRLENLDE
jgi:phosphoribosyl-AMP cyclohydrolase